MWMTLPKNRAEFDARHPRHDHIGKDDAEPMRRGLNLAAVDNALFCG